MFNLEDAQPMEFCKSPEVSDDPWRPTFKALPGSRFHCTPTNYIQELVGAGNSIAGIRVNAVFINYMRTAVKDAPTHIDANGKIYIKTLWDPAELVGDGDYIVFSLEADERCQYYHPKVSSPSRHSAYSNSRGRRR